MRKLILIEKMTASRNPVVPTAGWNNHAAGAINEGVSLPSGYVVEGYLVEEILIGRPVRILRTKRCGIETLGVFTSSPVTALGDNFFETENSVYRYAYLQGQTEHLLI